MNKGLSPAKIFEAENEGISSRGGVFFIRLAFQSKGQEHAVGVVLPLFVH